MYLIKICIFTYLTKKLLIYTYSLSNNLVKEAVYKLGLKLLLTKEIKKATIKIIDPDKIKDLTPPPL